MVFSRSILMRAGLTCGLVVIALLLWFVIARPIQVLPRMQPVAPFVLTDQTLRWVGDTDLLGRITLVTVGYSRCGQPCSGTETGLGLLHDLIRNDASLSQHVQFFTISLDPDHDTAPILNSYAQRLGADPQYWRLLTGSSAEVKSLVGGSFGVYYAQQSDGQITFEPQLILVDETGLIRARYPTAVPNAGLIERDINLLLRESRESRGSQRVIYEAAHLFVCYPQ